MGGIGFERTFPVGWLANTEEPDLPENRQHALKAAEKDQGEISARYKSSLRFIFSGDRSNAAFFPGNR